MNTHFWKRWAELDQFVRRLTVLQPSLLRKLADAPPALVHAYALYLRTTPWGMRCTLSTKGLAVNLTDPALIREIRSESNAEELSVLAAALEFSPACSMIASVTTASPKTVLKLLGRCGDVVRSSQFYDRLLSSTSDPRALCLLSRIWGDISEQDAAELDRATRLDPIIASAYCARCIDLTLALALDRLLQIIRHYHGNDHDRTFDNFLKKSKRLVTEKSLEGLLVRLPPAPLGFPDIEGLRALSTPLDVCRAARRYRNCLHQYMLDVILGHKAFFELIDEDDPAIIGLRRDAVFGWEIFEVRGKKNHTVPGHTRSKCIDLLAPLNVSRSMSVATMGAIIRGDLHLVQNELAH